MINRLIRIVVRPRAVTFASKYSIISRLFFKKKEEEALHSKPQ
jgi:predicted Ser/Thr protein kinase